MDNFFGEYLCSWHLCTVSVKQTCFTICWTSSWDGSVTCKNFVGGAGTLSLALVALLSSSWYWLELLFDFNSMNWILWKRLYLFWNFSFLDRTKLKSHKFWCTEKKFKNSDDYFHVADKVSQPASCVTSRINWQFQKSVHKNQNKPLLVPRLLLK